jgi:hypothetical protein
LRKDEKRMVKVFSISKYEGEAQTCAISIR